MKIGWYSETQPSILEKSVLYFNHVVNYFTPNADKNDVRIYTKENYIQCLKNLPLSPNNEINERFFVHLPYFQVFPDQDGNEIVIFDWYKDIVDATFDLPQVYGYYIADEPEVWGSGYTSTNTAFDQKKAKQAFSYIKSKCDKPVMLVFCDQQLFFKTKLNKNINKICDVLAFDFYPFMTREQIKSKNLAFEPGSVEERRWLEKEVVGFAKLYENLKLKNQNTPYYGFVTQGCGEFDQNGEPNFGQRDFTAEELDFLFATVCDTFFKKPDYYLFWDKHYADKNMSSVALDHITNLVFSPNWYIDWDIKRKPSIFKRIMQKIKKFLNL